MVFPVARQPSFIATFLKLFHHFARRRVAGGEKVRQ
jgi:hypothetical protein